MDTRTDELAERLVAVGHFPQMSASEGHELYDGIRKLQADRKALLEALKIMIASAVPHPILHPTMTAAWKVARAAIAQAEKED